MKNISYMLMGAGLAVFFVGMVMAPEIPMSSEDMVQLNAAGGAFLASSIILGFAWLAMWFDQVEP